LDKKDPLPNVGFGRNEAIRFLKYQFRALFDTKMQFNDLFDNYDQYWLSGQIQTDLTTVKLIENWIEDNSTVLDIGLGHGVVAETLLKEKHLKMKGIDISQVACDRAIEKGIEAQVRDINYGLGLNPAEIYDYILLTEVIEHTVYPHKILHESLSHARKGVIVTIPNSAFLVYRIQLLRGYFPRQSFTHLHYWSIKDFKIFCEQLGIKVGNLTVPLPKYLYPAKNALAYAQAWFLLPNRGEVHT
jgi:methionine biosynthesis protein MetW